MMCECWAAHSDIDRIHAVIGAQSMAGEEGGREGGRVLGWSKGE